MANPEPSFTVVLIGDPQACEALAESIRASDTLLLTGILDAGEPAATVVGRAPDLVVVVEPPDGAGADTADLAAQLGAALPASQILVALRGAAPADPSALVGSWVSGVIDLDASMPLVAALDALAHGEALLEPSLAAAVLERHRAGGSPVALTPTEEEVLGRLAEGDPVDTLAAEYAVSPRLVRLHAGAALARLNPIA